MKKSDIYDLFKKITILSFKKNYNELFSLKLYPGQPILLEAIDKNSGLSQRELSHLTLKQPATITTMLKRMEKENLIIKKDDSCDKRSYKLYLTDKGKSKLKKIEEIEYETINNIFKDFNDKEIDIMYKLMEKIKNNLELK